MIYLSGGDSILSRTPTYQYQSLEFQTFKSDIFLWYDIIHNVIN